MTYHLARAAYYLQHGNLGYFEANYWAQVVHPKNSTVLFIHSFLVSGRNERAMQLVQYASYWISVLAVYGIAKRVGWNHSQSLFSCLVFALMIENLMESATTQNDMLIIAYVGSLVFFVLSFRVTAQIKHRVLAAASLALAVGVKVSVFLMLPSVALVAMYCLVTRRDLPWRRRGRDLALFLGLLFAAFLLVVLPAGYPENYRVFGHPLGPEQVRKDRSYEYPLFGERWTRTLIPVNSFWRGIQAVPQQVDFLLYSNLLLDVRETDIHLGQDWYLRKLASRPLQ